MRARLYHLLALLLPLAVTVLLMLDAALICGVRP